jgi:EmrB/QacA subfamily drug resistance transporter
MLDRHLLSLAAVVVLGAFVAILDATIVNVALPTLGADLDAQVATLQWVMTAYLLAFAGVIPLSPWATRRFGDRAVFLAAVALFTAGSALSASAWSIESLIAFRAVQGLGGGLIMPVGQAILARAAGPQRIGRVMSVVGVPMLLAPILGPLAGGAIVDSASWRWIFLVNLPVGLVTGVLAYRILPGPAPGGRARLDVRGLALLCPGIVLLVYGTSEAGAAGGFASARTLLGVGAGAALVALFVARSRRRGPAALLDVTLFARRRFAAAAAVNFLIGVALFGALILLPLYFQLVRGASPFETGLQLVPQGIGAALAMPLAGRLTDGVGARPVIAGGVLLALAGTAVYTQVGADTSDVLLAAALLVIGLGLGSTIMPSMALAYQAVPREAVGQATAAINVIQRLAGSLGTALLAVVLQSRLDGAHGAAEQAAAFAGTFWVALALLAAAVVPVMLLSDESRARARSTPASVS